MATEEQVEETLRELVSRMAKVEDPYRSLLPSKRTVEAVFTDIDVTYHTVVRRGQADELQVGRAPRADIRVKTTSDDLLRLADGTLRFSEAYATRRVTVRASMSDLLLLRSVL